MARWRQIGLGIMGLADALIKLGLTYGEEDAVEMCDRIGFAMADAAIAASARLAREQGAFPGCKGEEIMETPYFLENTSEQTRELVRKYGLRNSQLLTIAPTGTLSTMLGISGGIEPVYANYYERKTESLHGTDVYYKVYTKIVEQYMKELRPEGCEPAAGVFCHCHDSGLPAENRYAVHLAASYRRLHQFHRQRAQRIYRGGDGGSVPVRL